jgi:hypothetical protein
MNGQYTPCPPTISETDTTLASALRRLGLDAMNKSAHGDRNFTKGAQTFGTCAAGQ